MAPSSENMSGYKNFAIVGAGTLGNYVIRQFLKEKAAGVVNEVIVLTRQVSSNDPNWHARRVPTHRPTFLRGNRVPKPRSKVTSRWPR